MPAFAKHRNMLGHLRGEKHGQRVAGADTHLWGEAARLPDIVNDLGVAHCPSNRAARLQEVRRLRQGLLKDSTWTGFTSLKTLTSVPHQGNGLSFRQTPAFS